MDRDRSLMRGRVTGFDREVGLGVVRGSDGADYAFHCIEIADGTRDIALDAEVCFVVLERFGRREAGRLTPWR